MKIMMKVADSGRVGFRRSVMEVHLDLRHGKLKEGPESRDFGFESEMVLWAAIC